MPPDPPVPIAGIFNPVPPGASVLILSFDRDLLPGPVDVANFVVHWALSKYTTTVAVAGVPTARDVTLTCAWTPLGAPPGDVVNYRPPPFDVQTPRGTPAAAFEAFPIV